MHIESVGDVPHRETAVGVLLHSETAVGDVLDDV